MCLLPVAVCATIHLPWAPSIHQFLYSTLFVHILIFTDRPCVVFVCVCVCVCVRVCVCVCVCVCACVCVHVCMCIEREKDLYLLLCVQWCLYIVFQTVQPHERRNVRTAMLAAIMFKYQPAKWPITGPIYIVCHAKVSVNGATWRESLEVALAQWRDISDAYREFVKKSAWLYYLMIFSSFLIGSFLPIENLQGNCVPAALQKIQPYPGRDLNPEPRGLEHSTFPCRFSMGKKVGRKAAMTVCCVHCPHNLFTV